MRYHPLSDCGPPPAVYVRPAPAAPVTTPLAGALRTQVVVIGAGFTGLSAALHLAEAGVEVVVLEAKELGWGASGRAFGQVVPYLKISEASILRHYGAERGAAIIDAVAGGPELVFDLIGRHRIECWAVRTGLLFAAHAPAGRRGLIRRAEFWQRRGTGLELLEGGHCAAAIGSSLYDTALLDRRGGHLNPFAYVRGLACAAVRTGATIHTKTRVERVTRHNGAWLVDAGGARVSAGCVLIATNAYTSGFWPGLSESIVPVRGYGFISAPLSDNVRGSVLPGRQSLTDTRRLLSAVRLLPDGRLHASARGAVSGPERTADLRAVNARIRRLFPQLDSLSWEQSWSGWMAMTPDHMPRVHELAPWVFAGLGYNGRGIAAATMMGRDLATLARGGSETVFPRVPQRPLPYARIAPLLARGVAGLYRLQDALDELRPGPRRHDS